MSSGYVPWALIPIVALIEFCVVYSGSSSGYIHIIHAYMDSPHPQLSGGIYFMTFGQAEAKIWTDLWGEPNKTTFCGGGTLSTAPLPQNAVLFVLSHSCNTKCSLLAHFALEHRTIIYN